MDNKYVLGDKEIVLAEYTQQDMQEKIVDLAMDQVLGVGTGVLLTLVVGYMLVQRLLNQLKIGENIIKLTSTWEEQTDNLKELSKSNVALNESMVLLHTNTKEIKEEVLDIKVSTNGNGTAIHDGNTGIKNILSQIEFIKNNQNIFQSQLTSVMNKLGEKEGNLSNKLTALESNLTQNHREINYKLKNIDNDICRLIK